MIFLNLVLMQLNQYTSGCFSNLFYMFNQCIGGISVTFNALPVFLPAVF